MQTKTIFHRRNTSFNTGIVLLCKTMHHSGGTIVWLATRIIDIYESSIDAIIFNEPSCPPKLLTIHPKILTEICMQVGLMVTPH